MSRKPGLNASDVRSALRALGREIRKGAWAGVRAGLGVLEDGVTRRAPVGETHDLKRSVRATAPHDSPRGVSGLVVIGSGHAAAVEYGTGREAAQPFIRPAVDEDGPAALNAAARALKGFL